MKKYIRSNRGFTLLELIVVVGILALLAVFALAALNPLEQFRKARDTTRKSDLTQIQRGLEQYYQDHGRYPASSGTYTLTDFNGTTIPWGGSTGWVPYMNVVPKDVDSSRMYIYVSENNGQIYKLYTSLELGPHDPSTCMATVANCLNNPSSVAYCTCSGVPAGVDCGVGTAQYPCNFGVTSPNTTP